MRSLLPLSLAAVAAAVVAGCAVTPSTPGRYTVASVSAGPSCRRLAQPGDTKIQLYCRPTHGARTPAASATASDDSSCRWLEKASGNAIESVCGDKAKWDEYDTQALTAGVTCRWAKGLVLAPGPAAATTREICLTASQWKPVDTWLAQRRSAASGSGGYSSSGGSGDSGSGAAYASSYGYFPAGTAIGGP